MSSILHLYESAKIQRIDDAGTEMERNGLMNDAEYCARGYETAIKDEAFVLESLRGALTQKGVDLASVVGQPDPDAIWTSPVQLPKLLEQGFGLPPSPYRMKGKVNLDAGQRS